MFMEECSEAFADDRDIIPIGVIDSSIDAQTVTPRSRERLTKYQQEKLKIKRDELESRTNFRRQMLEAINKIVDKI